MKARAVVILKVMIQSSQIWARHVVLDKASIQQRWVGNLDKLLIPGLLLFSWTLGCLELVVFCHVFNYFS